MMLYWCYSMVYLIKVSLNKRMNQVTKASLRPRRAPKTFEEENQEIDPYGYGRPAYHKEIKTPAQILNHEAKLLIRFINSANKSAREQETQHRRKEMENIKEPVAIRGAKGRSNDPVGDVRRREEVSHGKGDLSRKGREVYSLKMQLANSEGQPPLKSQGFLNKIKNLSMQSASNMRMLEMNIAKKNDPSKLPSQKTQPAMRKSGHEAQWQPKALQGGANKVAQSQAGNSIFFRDKQKMRKMHETEDRLGLQHSDFSSNNKIFKRSAYHVAIAYHIYLRKIREKGPIGGEIDPTFHARRLKQDMSRSV